MSYRIPFIKPAFPNADDIAVDYERIVSSNWFTNFGPYEREFSVKAAAYVGGGVSASTVSNATLGLFIAIKLLFSSRGGNKVLVPSFTFAAGPEMLIMSGLTPVFMDIEQGGLQPCLSQARTYIESNKDDMAGVLLCNIFGVGNTDIDSWESLAEEFGLPLIIDSAAGFGSEYNNGEKIGARGACEIFSLHATKPFSVGEGGLVVSRDDQFIKDVESFQNFGFDAQKKIGFVGINAKLQELNAAIGIRQLVKFQERLAHRRMSLAMYKSKLMPLGYTFQENDEYSTVPFVSVMAKSVEDAEKVRGELLGNGVEARKYYEPLHTQEVLSRACEYAGHLSVTEDVYGRIISLPLHDSMTQSDIDFIVGVIAESHE